MKRMLALLTCLFLARAVWAQADPLANAAALAAQREAEERAKRLAAELQNLQETQELLVKRYEDFRQRLEKLTDEVRSLREDQSRNSGSTVSRDEFRKYVEKLREVDEKREADKKLILDNIRELAKVPVAPPVETKPSSKRTTTPEPNEEAPYIYTIKKNDRLLDIIAEYNEHFQKNGLPKITLEQVLRANPGLKPDRLIAGRKIRIPVLGKEAKQGQ